MPDGRPSIGRRVAGWATAVLVAVILLVVAGWVVLLAAARSLGDAADRTVTLAEEGRPPLDDRLGPIESDPDAEPTVQADPPAGAGTGPGTSADAEWLERVSAETLVPSRVLAAYAAADLRLRAEQPDCGLSWATLAGIGWVESRHGTIDGNSLGEDGRPVAGPIVGVALDGVGPVASVPDTDGGTLDADTTWDRAVGPLQFIPTTWSRWGADADGDGAVDPQDVDDAAYSAGRYLCDSGSPLTDPDQWRRAVLTYNASAEYAVDVVAATNHYARQSRP